MELEKLENRGTGAIYEEREFGQDNTHSVINQF